MRKIKSKENIICLLKDACTDIEKPFDERECLKCKFFKGERMNCFKPKIVIHTGDNEKIIAK